MSVAPVVGLFILGVVFLISEAVIHLGFQQFLDGIGKKLLYQVLGVLCRLQVILLDDLLQ